MDPFKLYHALIFSRIESKWKECRISENSTWRFSLITFVFLLLSESNISFIINLQQVSILLLGVFAGEIFNIALKYCLDSRPDKFIGILEHNTLFIVDGKYYQKYFRLTKDVWIYSKTHYRCILNVLCLKQALPSYLTSK